MEIKFIWVIDFRECDFQELNCAFDTFEKAKAGVQEIFDKVSAVNPAWQNLETEICDDEQQWAVYKWDYIGEDADLLTNEHQEIDIFPIPFNSLPFSPTDVL